MAPGPPLSHQKRKISSMAMEPATTAARRSESGTSSDSHEVLGGSFAVDRTFFPILCVETLLTNQLVHARCRKMATVSRSTQKAGLPVTRKSKSTPANSPAICPTCGKALGAGQPHATHGFRHLKMQLDGFLKPGQAFHRNLLFDTLYEQLPKDPKAHVQIYHYEICPGGFTNWHIHTGATFYLTLQGLFEGHFQEGVLISGKPGQVYSEPIGKIHRGHNAHPEIPLLGIGVAMTSPGIEPIINVERPVWASANDQ